MLPGLTPVTPSCQRHFLTNHYLESTKCNFNPFLCSAAGTMGEQKWMPRMSSTDPATPVALASPSPKATRYTDFKTNAYVVGFSASLYMVLLITPMITTKLVEQYSLSASAVGTLLFIEIGAFSFATIPSYLWLRRFNLTLATWMFGAIAVLGNVLSGFAGTVELLIASRVVTSLAAGSITVIILALARKANNPSRSYALFLVSQLGMAAVFLAIYPVFFENRSVSAIYFALAILAVVCLPLAGLIDPNAYKREAAAEKINSHGKRATSSKRLGLSAAMGLTAILLFYISLSSVWAFMAEIGSDSQIDMAAISLGLSGATITGIVAALTATALGEHRRSNLLVLLSYAGLAGSMALLFGTIAAAQFIIAAGLFKFTYTFILPYIVTSVAKLDPSGYLTSTINLVGAGGFSLGPLVGGTIISWSGNYTVLLVVSIALMLTSMFITYRLQRRIGNSTA